jgi:hypothetical protein
MATFGDIISQAFFDAGITDSPGQTMPPNHTTAAANQLNRLIASYNNRPPWLYRTRSDIFTLTALVDPIFYYTMGPTGQWVTTRPVGPLPGKGIVNANILTGDGISLPVRILGDEEWQTETLKEISTSIPWALWNDGAFPNSKIYLRGYPDSGYRIEIYQREQIAAFSSVGETFAMAPGYEDALTLTLAEKLRASGYKILTPNPGLAEQARTARVYLTSIQTNAPLMRSDASGMFDGDDVWDWRTGGNA